MTPAEAAAGLDALRSQAALLRAQLDTLQELLAELTPERAAEIVNGS